MSFSMSPFCSALHRAQCADLRGVERSELRGRKRTHPASFLVQGAQISLGSVVRGAFEQFEKDNKTAAEWNALPAVIRDQFISDQVALIRG